MIWQHAIALAAGYALDLVIGDPPTLPHPVRWMGRLISALEGPLRKAFPKTPGGQRAAGTAMAVCVVGVSVAVAGIALWLCGLVNVWLATAVEALICASMLATKSLRTESMKVFDALETGTIDDARFAVSMIVGRDTAQLTESEVACAAVETVAENTSDGIVAPLFYMALFGALGGVFYKAVNTMDSMIGYRNDEYRYFGTAAARLDDVLNYIPARFAACAMTIAAFLLRFDGSAAWRIYRRDHANHLSPNSAHTEAVCAGALGIRLGGAHYYFGKLVEKPTIGDALRPVEAYDIVRANKLMYATSVIACVVCLTVSAALGFAGWAV